MNTVKFSQKIRDLRTEHRLSQEDLASILCISFQAISKWECGLSYPDIELIPVIADYFNVSCDYLIRDTEKCKSYSQNIALPYDDVLRVVFCKGGRVLEQNEYDPDIRIKLTLGEEFTKNTKIELSVEGNLDLEGDVYGYVEANGYVNCENIGGYVEAEGMVNCGGVGGYVEANGMVNCGGVGGYLEANGGVNCGRVDGYVEAKGGVNCGNIGQYLETNGDVNCGNIGQSLETNGNVTCGSISGSVEANRIEAEKITADTVSCEGDIICNIIEGNNIKCEGRIMNKDN